MALRILLIVVSFLTSFGIIRKIRKSQLKIEDALFWIVFSLVLVVLSLFPSLAVFASNIAGVASPVNFIFLTVIFILIIKVFLLSTRLSVLEHKLQTFVQVYALKENLKEKEKTTQESGSHCVGGGFLFRHVSGERGFLTCFSF